MSVVVFSKGQIDATYFPGQWKGYTRIVAPAPGHHASRFVKEYAIGTRLKLMQA